MTRSSKLIRQLTIFGSIWLSFAIPSWADPLISGAQIASQVNAIELTVSGSNFGNQGPNVVIYDSFEDFDDSDAQWTDATPTFGGEGRTGTKSHLGYSSSGDGLKILRTDLGASFDDIYLSYWVKLGTDYFPGSSAYTPTAPKTFPDNSSWKFLWLMDGSDGYQANNDFDMCIPSHTGNGGFLIAGNDGNFENPGNSWWSWEGWVRISALIQKVSGNYGFFQTTSAEHGNDIQSFGNDSPFLPGVTSTFSYITMPGWMRSSDEPVEVFYDDVYIAVGEHAAARIEIANSPDYNAATVIDVAKPVTWDESEITASLPIGSELIESGSGYLFVFDSSGNRNSTGFPLCSSCPESPGPY